MLTALTLGFVLGPSLQQKIDNSNFKSYFDQCERKGAYLESPPENSSGSPQFLGKLTASKYGADSIANSYGKYGSTTGQESIWNAYSKFGGKFSARSPWNSYARKPVEILYRMLFIGARLGCRTSIPSTWRTGWIALKTFPSKAECRYIREGFR